MMTHGTLFVGGFPSSGTDLLRNILNAHDHIFVGGEFPLLPSLASDYDSIIAAEEIISAQDAVRKIDVYGNLKNTNIDFPVDEPIAFSELFSRMLWSGNTQLIGSKTPQNTENIDRLVHLFPDARFIIVVRDVRDVAMSWRKKWGKSVYLCANKWHTRMKKGLDATDQLSADQFLFVTFESVLRQLGAEAARICKFLDIPFDSKMLEFQEFVKEAVPGKINFGQRIIKGNSGNWMNGFRTMELERIEQIAFPTMKRFGYVPELAVSQSPLTKTEHFLGLLKDFVATVFIGNRSLTASRFSHRIAALRVLSRKLKEQIRGNLN